jgi:hypothetical protein
LSALAFVVAGAAVAGCMAVPTLQYIDDDLADGGVSPTTSGIDAMSPSSEAAAAGDDSGSAADSASADSSACTIPTGVKGAKCCGDLACIGTHCNATQACTDCAGCAGHLFCCANTGSAVTCSDNPSGC